MTQSLKIWKQYIYIHNIYISIWLILCSNHHLKPFPEWHPQNSKAPIQTSGWFLYPIGSHWLISYEIFISRWAIQDASEELNPLRRQWSPTSWQLSWHLVELVIQDCAWKLGLIPRSEGMIKGNSSSWHVRCITSEIILHPRTSTPFWAQTGETREEKLRGN